VTQAADSRRRADIPILMRLCAARTAQELNVGNISGELALPATSVRSYLAQLEAAFLVWSIPAWSTNLSAKVVRRPKLMLPDSGLAAALLRVDETTADRPGGHLGPLLETFVATELRKQVSWSTVRPTISHFRDRGGTEVDLVLEHPDGRVVGLEVKATSSPKLDDFKGLRLLADRLGDRFVFGAVLSAAPEANPFGPKLATLPVDVLWRR
jgi:predicted AAA+ superfamily ATPase